MKEKRKEQKKKKKKKKHKKEKEEKKKKKTKKKKKQLWQELDRGWIIITMACKIIRPNGKGGYLAP